MKYSIIYSIILLLLGCSTEHINKERYDVLVGETIEIYYGENSCCGRCWNNIELNHLDFIKVNKIEFDEDCAGCTNTFSIVYKATSVGVDTVKTQSYAMSDSCNLNSDEIDVFFVTIKKRL